MALSAAFSMARIIIGVANTCGSIASLNWLARCAGITRSVKVPFAPGGIGRIIQYNDHFDSRTSPVSTEGSCMPRGCRIPLLTRRRARCRHLDTDIARRCEMEVGEDIIG